MRYAAALLLLALTSCSAPQAPRPTEQGPQGFASVPRADPSTLEWSRSPEEWGNPFIIVRRDGFELISQAKPSGAPPIGVDRMRLVLLSLPRDAWPLGRVVAVQEIGIRSGNDDELIDGNSAALKTMLGELDIQISWWPSA